MVGTEFVNPRDVVSRLLLKEGMHIGDFGAGSGAYTLLVSPLVGQTGKVYAIDVQKDILLRLKQLGISSGLTNVSYIWTDFEHGEASGIKSGTLDVALLSNTLFQLDNKLGALHEIYRTLKPRGRLFIIEWADSFKGLGPEQERVVTRDEVMHLARQAGFSITQEFTPGEHHYGLECSK